MTLRNPDGTRKDYLLGPYNSSESRAEYLRLVSEWQENHQRIPSSSKSDLTINELILAFWQHVEAHYRLPNGEPTSEVHNIRAALKPLRKLYGTTLVRDFGPLALKAVRRVMIADGAARKTINGRVSRIRLMFRWGVGEEMVSSEILHALEAVDGLKAGRTEAHDPEKIKPVTDDAVNATLKHLSPIVAAMVQVQRLTGSRPGEVCTMRRSEIDTSGGVWLYRPSTHKNKWRDKDRVIGIGPKAQAILTPFFTSDPKAYLFSPQRAMEALRAGRSTKRQTPRYPSHMRRNATKRKKQPQRTPAECYDANSYRHAIIRACDLAFPPPDKLKRLRGETTKAWLERLKPEQQQALKEWREQHRWHPNQLRHSFGTQVRKCFGLEASQVTLGHSEADTTQIYAEADAEFITRIAAQIG